MPSAEPSPEFSMFMGHSELDRHMDGHGSGDSLLEERNRTPKFPQTLAEVQCPKEPSLLL